MDGSVREASHIEQSIVPKIAYFGAIGTRRGKNTLHKSFFSCFSDGLIFCEPKNVFLCVFCGSLFLHFLSFYTMQLAQPKC